MNLVASGLLHEFQCVMNAAFFIKELTGSIKKIDIDDLEITKKLVLGGFFWFENMQSPNILRLCPLHVNNTLYVSLPFASVV